jgi:hypothetical protein
MALHVKFEEQELPELKQLLQRALNCWNPAEAPKWAYELDALVEAKINEIKERGNESPRP